MRTTRKLLTLFALVSCTSLFASCGDDKVSEEAASKAAEVLRQWQLQNK